MTEHSTPQETHARVISERVRQRRVVPVVGAGISIAAAGLPDWRGLLDHGIDHLEATYTVSHSEINDLRNLAETGDVVAAASKLKTLLGYPRGEFAAWLDALFSEPRSVDASVLHALYDLEPPLFLTTNYDLLLIENHPRRPEVVTWQNPPRMQVALSRGDGSAILHVHGVFTEPDSVVFGIDDYEALVADPAYRDVLRSLWLTQTLLFVGASFDGLSDPDLLRMVDWASATFGENPAYKHYALVPDDAITPERAREFLYHRRIQLVGYGAAHGELRPFLERLNPRLDEARAARVEIARSALEGDDGGGEDAFARAVAGLVAVTGLVAERPDELESSVHALFEARSADVDRRRGEMQAAQRLLRRLVDDAPLRKMLEWWKAEGWAKRTLHMRPPEPFLEVVKQAGRALFLIPHDLLVAVARRGVAIHGRVLDGYCESLVRQMADGVPITGEDGYKRENLARVLTSYDAFVTADPDQVFPPPRPASDLVTEPSSFLLLRWAAVELRPSGGPSARRVEFSHEPGPIDVQAVIYRGEPVVATWNDEMLLLWNPCRSLLPIAELALEQPGEGAPSSVTHEVVDDRLRTILCYETGLVRELVDLERSDEWRVDEFDRVSSSVFWRSRLFLRLADDRVVEVERTGLRHIATPDEVLAWLEGYPLVPTAGRLGLWELSVLEVSGRPTLTFDGVLRQLEDGFGEQGVVVLTTPDDPLSIDAVWAADPRPQLAVTSTADPTGTPWLHAALLPGRETPHSAIVWARLLGTREGAIFVTEGEVAIGERDVVGIVPRLDGGVAADSHGRLLQYSMSRREVVAELAPAGESGVRSLQLVNWTS